MFIRRKKNASGSTSILILEKRSRNNVILKAIGTSSDLVESEYLHKKAQKEIERLQLSTVLPFDQATELAFADSFTNCIEVFSLVGPELLLGKISLANAMIGYVPPASQFALGGYETWLCSGSFAATNAEEKITVALMKLIHSVQ